MVRTTRRARTRERVRARARARERERERKGGRGRGRGREKKNAPFVACDASSVGGGWGGGGGDDDDHDVGPRSVGINRSNTMRPIIRLYAPAEQRAVPLAPPRRKPARHFLAGEAAVVDPCPGRPRGYRLHLAPAPGTVASRLVQRRQLGMQTDTDTVGQWTHGNLKNVALECGGTCCGTLQATPFKVGKVGEVLHEIHRLDWIFLLAELGTGSDQWARMHKQKTMCSIFCIRNLPVGL